MNLIDIGTQHKPHLEIDPTRVVIRLKEADQNMLKTVFDELKYHSSLREYEIINVSRPDKQFTDVVIRKPSKTLAQELVSLADGKGDDSTLGHIYEVFDYDEDFDIDAVMAELGKVGNGTSLEACFDMTASFPSEDSASKFVDLLVRHVSSPHTRSARDTSVSFILGSKDEACCFKLDKQPKPIGWRTYQVKMSLVITKDGLEEAGVDNAKQLLMADLRELLFQMIGVYDGDKYSIGKALFTGKNSERSADAYLAKFDEVYGNEKHLGVMLKKKYWSSNAVVNRIRELLL